jgi:type IV pilus assembly protein PilC
MAKEFHYKAINKTGDIISGFKKSTDEVSLSKELETEGIKLLSADEVSKFNFRKIGQKILTAGTVSTHDKIIIYKNLGAMLDAGLPLSRALTVMSKQAKNRKLKKVLDNVNESVRKGSSLSESLEAFPKIFTPLMVSMVRAGEETGNLVDALRVTAGQMDNTYKLQKKIKGAMIYPGVIISAMTLIGIFMLIYVVPTLTGTFSEIGVELPASTQFIINSSDFFQNNLILVFSVLLGIVALFSIAMKTPVGRKAFHWTILHLPAISPLVKEINSARTTRTLASLLSAGVPFVRALQITKDVMQNTFYKETIAKAEKNVQIGKPMSKVFAEAENLFPTFVGEMMAVGEETGNVGGMLLEVAIFYENEVDQKTKNISTIIEPVLMVIVGAAVGFFAISMISPMYGLVENI